MPFCTKCGTQYQEGQTFCGNCGLNLNTNQVKNESISFDNTKAPSKKEASIHGYGLGFVLSFFVGIAGLIIALILGDDEIVSNTISIKNLSTSSQVKIKRSELNPDMFL